MTKMKERPMLFNGEMVRAILDGRKTETRRPVKPQPVCIGTSDLDRIQYHGRLGWCPTSPSGKIGIFDPMSYKCPYGVPGDRLWVRETCRAEELPSGLDIVRYRADNGFVPIENTPEASDAWCDLYAYRHSKGSWAPSIHMPRWASRITLEITEISIEKARDIRAEDCLADGIRPRGIDPVDIAANLVEDFREEWDDIYADRGFGWDINPWIWVVRFQS